MPLRGPARDRLFERRAPTLAVSVGIDGRASPTRARREPRPWGYDRGSRSPSEGDHTSAIATVAKGGGEWGYTAGARVPEKDADPGSANG